MSALTWITGLFARRQPKGAAAATTPQRHTRRSAHRARAAERPQFGYRSVAPGVRETIEAAYDALANGGIMRNAWVNADHLSADEANSASVRMEARRRSRYECLEANSYLKGAIHTVAADMIGRGPRLQMQLTGALAKFNKPIERAWRKWSKKTRLAKTLRTMAITKIVDGETFCLFTTSSRTREGMASLYVRAFESDRCTSLVAAINGPHQVDGLEIDTDTGEVVAYFVHDTISASMIGEPRRIPADEVCHWFRQDRAGQHRGIPELLTSLPLCQLFREYTISVVTAARTAAKHTGVLETASSDVSEDDEQLTALSTTEIDYDMLTVLPKGYKLSQMKAEQPTSMYEMTRDCILGEIVRPLQAPLNIVLGSSAKWNYASTQADQVTYDLKLLIEREECETEVIEPTFAEWWREMQLLGLAPEKVDADEVEHTWFWDRRRDADPQTMATARETNLKVGATNREEQLGLNGIDIETHDETAAKSLGVTVPQYRLMLAKSMWGSDVVDSALQAGSTSSVGMNGAQIQGLVLIVQQVGAKTMAPAAARAVASAAFPQLDAAKLLEIFPDPIVDPAAAAPSPSGVYTEIGQRAFNNNLKRIQKILVQVANGTMNRVLAETTLSSIGLPADQISTLLEDAADGQIDSPELQGAAADGP